MSVMDVVVVLALVAAVSLLAISGLIMYMQYRGMTRRNSSSVNSLPVHASNEQFAQLELLRQYRHDWMNRLQMVVAYVQLNKQAELTVYLKKLMQTGDLEKFYFQTGSAQLGVWLLLNSARYEDIDLQMEVTRLTSREQLSLDEPAVVHFVDMLLESIQKDILPSADARPVLRLEITEQRDCYEMKGRFVMSKQQFLLLREQIDGVDFDIQTNVIVATKRFSYIAE